LSAIAILRQLRWLHVQVRVFWRYATIRLQEMAVAYAPPCLHLIACAIIGLGYFVRPWQWLLGGMEYLIVADFPVSFLGVGLAWSHQVLALTWFVVAGTLWWYLLARLAGIRGRTNKTASGERQCGSISDKGTIALIGSVCGEQKAQSCRSLYSRICSLTPSIPANSGCSALCSSGLRASAFSGFMLRTLHPQPLAIRLRQPACRVHQRGSCSHQSRSGPDYCQIRLCFSAAVLHRT